MDSPLNTVILVFFSLVAWVSLSILGDENKKQQKQKTCVCVFLLGSSFLSTRYLFLGEGAVSQILTLECRRRIEVL